jgi:DNA-directed RNA polymerase subunit H (RpoH/RPB5)
MAKQNSNVLISSIYNSRKNVLDLMYKQNYNIDEYSNFSINEVNSMFQNNQLDIKLEKNTKENKAYIHYYLGKAAKTITAKNLQDMIDDLFMVEEILTKNDTLFIILKSDINETITNVLKNIWEKDGIFIVIINIQRLQFNILEHSLVPPHRILSEEEVEEVKIKYNINKLSQLPEISRFDPVAQVIGIRPGQVCEIIRSSKTAVNSKYYRVCIQ